MTVEAPPADRPAGPPLARTALALLPFHVLLRGGEALLPLALAACFGRSSATDLYYVLAAYFVLAGAVVTGAFQDSGAIPILIEVGTVDPEGFDAVAGALLGHTLVVGLAVGALAGGTAAALSLVARPSPWLALELVGLMAAGTVATSVRAFYVGLMNARGVFRAHPLASGVGMGLTWGVLFATRGSLGVVAIPLATLSGELLAVGVLVALTRTALGRSPRPNLRRSEPIRRIFALVRLELTGSLITRVNPVIDLWMAGLAGVTGGGTLLRYAADVASLPTSLLQATLFPVLLTRLAGEARHPAAFRSTTRRTLAAVIALEVVVALLVAAARRPVCAVLWGRGAMDAGGVEAIAAILPWALAGAAPFAALLVLARAHVALQNSRIMPGMGVLNSSLNAAFNLLLVGPLGLAGIALSTSLTYVVVAVVFWVRLPRGARA